MALEWSNFLDWLEKWEHADELDSTIGEMMIATWSTVNSVDQLTGNERKAYVSGTNPNADAAIAAARRGYDSALDLN